MSETEFRLLVCGGRDYHDEAALRRAMSDAVGERRCVTVIHGDARGADRLAGRIAAAVGVRVIACPADWNRHGKAAGHRRNQEMLDEHKPHLVLAAPGGAGTADMVRRAERAGVPVIVMRGAS